MARRPAAKRTAKKANGAPRKPRLKIVKDEAPEIHEDDLSHDQLHAKIIEHSRILAKHDLSVKDATDARKAARDTARAQLGKQALHKIRLYEELASEEGQERLRAKVEMQMQIATLAGMPTRQLDIFEDVDRTPVADKAYEDGKTTGLSGDAGTPPAPYNSGTQMQHWMRGYGEGINVWRLNQGIKREPAHSAAH